LQIITTRQRIITAWDTSTKIAFLPPEGIPPPGAGTILTLHTVQQHDNKEHKKQTIAQEVYKQA
jgi:hypothetical protein